jgi:hypothetical protein
MNNETSSLQSTKSKNLINAILISGLIIGVLDGLAAITSAFIARGTSPVRVFQYIASGVFGREAFSGSTSMVFLGLFFHLFIALCWTALFFLLYRSFRYVAIFRKKIITGMIYGVIVWLGMQFIIVPLSNVPRAGGFNFAQASIGILIHMFIIGVPMAWLAARYIPEK